MTNTVDQAIAFARATPLRDGGSWAGWCASFVFRAGGFDRAYSSAMLAGSSSGLLAGDWHTARKGEIHYWAGVGGDGHVAIDIGGDTSDRLLLMASSAVSELASPNARAVGFVWMSQYEKLGIPYRGHTFAWGSERLEGTAVAAPTPTPDPIQGAIMSNGAVIIRQGTPGYQHKVESGRVEDTYGHISLVGPNFVNHLPGGGVYEALIPIYGPYINLTGDQYWTAVRELQAPEKAGTYV